MMRLYGHWISLERQAMIVIYVIDNFHIFFLLQIIMVDRGGVNLKYCLFANYLLWKWRFLGDVINTMLRCYYVLRNHAHTHTQCKIEVTWDEIVESSTDMTIQHSVW